MAASDASMAVVDVLVAIGAGGPEVGVGDFEGPTVVIGAAPASLFASCGASVCHPVAVASSANGVKFVKVKLLGFVRTMVLDFLIDAGYDIVWFIL